MTIKGDTTIRERRQNNYTPNQKRGYVTSHNIDSEKQLQKWKKMTNCKKGGKSRHYTNI
jgi:hypothetical protein